MGLFGRRRERREREEEEAVDTVLGLIRSEQLDSRRDYQTDSGEFDLRAFVRDVWEGSPTKAMMVVKEYWQPEGGSPTGERLYDDEFARHWDNLDRDERAEELEKLVRFSNFLVEQEAAERGAQVAVVHALVMEKMRLLSWAYDVTHDGDYTERIFRDPRQFGTFRPD